MFAFFVCFSFGTRLNGNLRRHQDCCVLEDSELIEVRFLNQCYRHPFLTTC